MAKGQTLIWTALPHGRDGVSPDGTLRLSVYVTPQLWNTDETVKLMQLSDFPDWIDFPAKVASMTFAVEFDGVPRSATVESVPLLRSDLWKALFDDDTLVFPYRFKEDDTSNSTYLVLETSTLAEAI